MRKSVILVTHDINEAFALGDRLGILEDGRLLAYGRPDAVAASAEPGVRLLFGSMPAPRAIDRPSGPD